ncbi:hypothetical protein [Pseudanabaena sp. FACHB-2040]|uniref:hypothetical protein n=1 Tax=Pseudanabaena sp. FACHB-2040 TaxID=2692859 RepID=UPI00168983BF|nr:hypothetical protein [Pseudanabaena sp. FACHB-2040]MBD2257292.1 hypothetical protein [Pseudanabaena sp. FACHB-2040]
MLPQILLESQLNLFKFWFNGRVQDGLHHRNELYYRAQTVKTDQRSRLYQTACRLAERQAGIVVSTADNHCSLWISLRNQKLAVTSLQQSVYQPSADVSSEASKTSDFL